MQETPPSRRLVDTSFNPSALTTKAGRQVPLRDKALGKCTRVIPRQPVVQRQLDNRFGREIADAQKPRRASFGDRSQKNATLSYSINATRPAAVRERNHSDVYTRGECASSLSSRLLAAAHSAFQLSRRTVKNRGRGIHLSIFNGRPCSAV